MHSRIFAIIGVGFAGLTAAVLLRSYAGFPAQTASEPPAEGSSSSAEFILPIKDVDWRSEEGAAVFYFLTRGVISGFPDPRADPLGRTFRGSEPISRAEAAKILLSAGRIPLTETQNNGRFLDIAEGEWYTPSVLTAAKRGIVTGYPPRHLLFAYRNLVNTAEFLKMLTITFNLRERQKYSFRDVPAEAWFAPYAGSAWQYKLFPERVEYLQPDQPLARRDVILALFRLFTVKKPRGVSEWFAPNVPALPFALPPNPCRQSIDLSVGGGVLKATQLPTRFNRNAIPRGAQRIPVLSIALATDSCAYKVALDSIAVAHYRGNSADISGFYVTINGDRVTPLQTVDPNMHTADVTFQTLFPVPRFVDCKPMRVDFVVDLSGAATPWAEHGILLARDLRSMLPLSHVQGPLLCGDPINISNTSVGTLSVRYLPFSPDEAAIGSTGAVIGTFALSANATEDQHVHAITLKQNGSGSYADVANVVIRLMSGAVATQNGTLISGTGSFMSLVFDPPFTITRWQTALFEVVADIRGNAGKNISVLIEEPSDIVAVGSVNGRGKSGQTYYSRIVLPSQSASPPDSVTIIPSRNRVLPPRIPEEGIPAEAPENFP